jgi:hypothetical protein
MVICSALKRTNSILTGDWLFCYIYAVYAVKKTNSILTGDWRFCYIDVVYAVKRTNSILTGNFYCINVTKTSVTC